MKKSLFIYLTVIMVAGSAVKSTAQVALTNNEAGAELVKVLTIVNTTPLHFGVIGITAGTEGTVVMNTQGVRTPGATTTSIINTGTQRTVARFDITGTTDDTYSITFPSSTISLTTDVGAGDKSMIINAIRISVDGASEEAAPYSGIHTLSSGASYFLVGGTLNISSTQQIGIYAGTYDVSVDYN